MKTLILILSFVLGCLLCTACNASDISYPDGTIVYSSSIGLIGRIAGRITGGHKYTHIGVVIDGQVYESDWPKICRGPVIDYGKKKTTNDYFVPKKPFTKEEVDKMRKYAISQLGKPYQLKNYFYPNSRPTKGTWCSVYAGRVLNASGRYSLTPAEIFEPQRIKNKIDSDYTFKSRMIRRR